MWTFAIVTETRISCLKFEKNRSHFLDFFLVSGCVVFISEFISTFVTFTFHEVSLFFFFVKRYFNTRREIVIWNVFQKEKFPIFSRPCNITRLNITVSKDWIMKLLFVCSQFSLNFHSIIKSHFIIFIILILELSLRNMPSLWKDVSSGLGRVMGSQCSSHSYTGATTTPSFTAHEKKCIFL